MFSGGSMLSKSTSSDLLFVSAAATWDLDKNNAVTCDEWKRYVSELFSDSDADKDGALTIEEYKSVIRADRLFETANLAYFDANNDGKVALQEMTEKPNPAFQILDKNNDCQIGANEMVQTRQIQQLNKSGSDSPNIPNGASGPGI